MSLTVLIVDDEENFRKTISKFLDKQGYTSIQAGTLAEARQALHAAVADIVLLDARLPDGFGPTLLEETAHIPNRPPVILITGHADVPMAVEAMDAGAYYLFSKPIDLAKLGEVIARAGEIVRMRRELNHLRQKQLDQFDFIVGDSPEMQRVMTEAELAARKTVHTLLTGETGTGKEVIAQAIHRMSPRADKPFVAINCAAIQSTVLESELFGYEQGAFTGAEKRKHGLFETADGGILFLDEISSMPLEMQPKILRAVQEQTFRRMGGNQEIQVDIQIIAATNRNLKKMMAEGTFREDLYFRLRVAEIFLPPLRNRKQDIPALVGFFIREQNPRKGTNIEGVTPAAMQILMDFDWPGNIRELEHVIERAVLYCEDAEIDIPHLPLELTRPELAY